MGYFIQWISCLFSQYYFISQDEDEAEAPAAAAAAAAALPAAAPVPQGGVGLQAGLGAAHQALLQGGGPTGFQPYKQPNMFHLRVSLSANPQPVNSLRHTNLLR